MTLAQRILAGHALGVLSTMAAVVVRPHVHEQPLGIRLLVASALVVASGIGLRHLVGPMEGSDGDSSGPSSPQGSGRA